MGNMVLNVYFLVCLHPCGEPSKITPAIHHNVPTKLLVNV